MNIKTKLNIDQKAYVLFMDKIHEVKIKEISVNVFDLNTMKITYELYKNPLGSQYTVFFVEEDLFSSKSDLVDTLLNNS